MEKTLGLFDFLECRSDLEIGSENEESHCSHNLSFRFRYPQQADLS